MLQYMRLGNWSDFYLPVECRCSALIAHSLDKNGKTQDAGTLFGVSVNKISCVYSINNIINSKRYIGSTRNFAQRKRKHASDLELGIHRSKHLQNAYTHYGKSEIEFKILVICEPFELLRYEQGLMNALRPEYNNLLTAGTSLGFRHTEETKKRISTSKMGHSVSEDTRKKFSVMAKGRKTSEETKSKISKASKGHTLTDEAKKIIREKATGRIASEETRRILSTAHKGKPNRSKTKFKPGLIPWNKGRPLSDECRAKLSKALKGKTPPNKGTTMSSELRSKISVSLKEYYKKKKEGVS
jgi:group I intron endonuclease